MRILHRFAIRCPVLTLLAAGAVMAAAAPGLLRLRLRTDGHALVPAHDPRVQAARAVREAFGVRDQVVLVVSGQDPRRGVFDPATLDVIARLTAEVSALPEVEGDVMSLATERGDRVLTGSLRPRPFLDPMPRTEEELDRLRSDLRAIRLYSGTLVARDERSSAVFVGVPAGVDRAALHRRLLERIQGLGPEAARIRIAGAPIAESLLGTHLLEDLGLPETLLGPAGSVGAGGAAPGLRGRVASAVGLMPLALGLMGLIFLIRFRRPAAAALPLIEIGSCLLIVFGVMGWAGVPVYLTISVMPVILTAVGIADEIHVFSRYRDLAGLMPGAAGRPLVTATMEAMFRPVVKTSLTTGFAFLTFATSSIAPVRAFGLCTALGVGLCMLWSLTVIPAMLVLLPRGWVVGAVRHGRGGRGARLEALGAAAVRHRWWVAGAVLATCLLLPLFVWRLRVQDSWVDAFARRSPFRAATDLVNRSYLGTHQLLVEVAQPEDAVTGEIPAQAVELFAVRVPRRNHPGPPQHLVGRWVQVLSPGAPGRGVVPEARGRHHSTPARIEAVVVEGEDLLLRTEKHYGSMQVDPWPAGSTRVSYRVDRRPLLEPAAIAAVCGLERLIEGREDLAVGGVLGPCDYLATTSYLLRQRREESDRAVPGEAHELLLLWQRYGFARGEERLRQVIDPFQRRVLVSAYLTGANFRDTARLMDLIRGYERDHLKPLGLSLTFSGDVAESQVLIAAIVSTQVRSLLLSLLCVVIITTILERSLRYGLLCAAPCALAVAINFAVMGAAGIPLGVATSMFSAMTLGIGVDGAIHLIERVRRSGALPLAAVRSALRVAGGALLLDAAAVILGFAVLTLSQVPANARLGALVALSMATCLVATVLLVPALVAFVNRPWPTRRGAGWGGR